MENLGFSFSGSTNPSSAFWEIHDDRSAPQFHHSWCRNTDVTYHGRDLPLSLPTSLAQHRVSKQPINPSGKMRPSTPNGLRKLWTKKTLTVNHQPGSPSNCSANWAPKTCQDTDRSIQLPVLLATSLQTSWRAPLRAR